MDNYIWQFFIFTGVGITAYMIKMMQTDLKDAGIASLNSLSYTYIFETLYINIIYSYSY